MDKNIILQRHIKNGVIIKDLNTTFIDEEVQIGRGVRIEPFNIITGKTVIGAGAVLGPHNVINDSKIGEYTSITSSNINSAAVGSNTTVGPWSYLRQGAVVGEECRIGDFVEIKNSVVGNKTKIAHFAYVGDAQVGERCNIGCGVVFVNYDGKNKHKTIVGNGVFVGSNVNLVAPLTLGDNAFIAAGSTVTHDVPANSLAIARQRQTNKENWINKKTSLEKGGVLQNKTEDC